MNNMIKTLLCVILVLFGQPRLGLAATQSADEPRPLIRAKADLAISIDVALSGNEEVLLGRVVDPARKPIAGAPVSLRAGNRVVAECRSDDQGRFAFTNLRGGVYQILVPDGFGTFRVWANGTAPRSADSQALVVAGRETIRGQQNTPPEEEGRLRRWLKNPLVLAGIVGVAVAVPVAVHNSKDNTGKATATPPGSSIIVEDPASD